MAVALVPSSGCQVGAEPRDTPRFDLGTKGGETRHGVANVVFEVRLRAVPITAGESVDAVRRDRYGRHRVHIEVAADVITFSFLPTHRALREQFDETRAWLETTAERVSGRRIAVTAVQATASTAAPAAAQGAAAPPAPAKPAGARDLRAEALSSSAVQAMLEVFPAEIRDVEEM